MSLRSLLRNAYNTLAMKTLGTLLLVATLLGLHFGLKTVLKPALARGGMATPVVHAAATQDGNNTTLTRNVGDFSSIRAEGPVEVRLTVGQEAAVTLSGPSPYIQDVETEVRSGTLYIRYDGRMYDYGRNRSNDRDKLVVNVSMATVAFIELRHACMLYGKATIKGTDLRVDLSNASVADLTLDVQNLQVSNDRASVLKLSGTAKKFTCDMGGAAMLKAYDLHANEASVEMNGASMGSIYAEQWLSATVYGASVLRYKGDATIRKMQTSGGSVFSKAR
jgi:hypothetical protein